MMESFGRYRLQAMLGHGGMGQVWRAFDTTTDRAVALKLLLPELVGDDAYRVRFEREARTASKLQNPHIVPIHNFGEIDGRLFIDMALLDGVDLEKLLRRHGHLPLTAAAEIIRQAASTIDAAHTAGLVHRDIKPSNIFIHASGHTYLIDFGIARRQSTHTQGQTGTFAYMAPEQFDGEAGPSVDVYALTLVLFQCLTGKFPFDDSSIAQLVAAHLKAPPPRPTDLIPTLPAALDGVIARGMAKDPAARYPTATALAHAVAAVERGETASTLLSRAVQLSQQAEHDDEPPNPPARMVDARALVDRGIEHLNRKEMDEAEDLFRQAAEADNARGMDYLGDLLHQRGETEEAERWYRKAANAGNQDSMHSLARMLSDRGETDEAELWYHKAADAGDQWSMYSLAWLLRDQGRTEEAEHWYRKAAEANHEESVVSLGILLLQRGETDEAELWLRKAADAGNATAMDYLGDLLRQRGETEEAESWYREAADAGNEWSMISLGRLLRKQGDTDEAEEWFREAANAGNATGINLLGDLLYQLDEFEEAEEWYRKAANAGNEQSMYNLAWLLREQDEIEEAEHWYRKAADAGHVKSMSCLADLLRRRDAPKEMEYWYRKAADAGNVSAMASLGYLRYKREDTDEAETWLHKAAEAGNVPGMDYLGDLLQNAGETDEAEVWYRKAANAGDTDSMYSLARALGDRGHTDEAEVWLRRAAEAGNDAAIDELEALLHDRTDNPRDRIQSRIDDIDRRIAHRGGLSPDERENLFAEAVEIFESADEAGNIELMESALNLAERLRDFPNSDRDRETDHDDMDDEDPSFIAEPPPRSPEPVPAIAATSAPAAHGQSPVRSALTHRAPVQQDALFDTDPGAEQRRAQDPVAELLATDLFDLQYATFGRKINREAIATILRELIDGNGTLPLARAADILGVKAFRAASAVSVLSQVLNTDGIVVLSINGTELALEVGPLFEQFGVTR
ncbi:serine/threonine-protein kinase [Rhodococcus koreensis]